jgi:hypothetical protein
MGRYVPLDGLSWPRGPNVNLNSMQELSLKRVQWECTKDVCAMYQMKAQKSKECNEKTRGFNT